jgi:hypothetical protein
MIMVAYLLQAMWLNPQSDLCATRCKSDQLEGSREVKGVPKGSSS